MEHVSISLKRSPLILMLLAFSITSVESQTSSSGVDCDKCRDSKGDPCNDQLSRFEQSQYWLPTRDFAGFGLVFQQAEDACKEFGYTMAVLSSNNDDLKRAVQYDMLNGSLFDKYWVVKNSSGMQAAVMNSSQELPLEDVDTALGFVCQFLKNKTTCNMDNEYNAPTTEVDITSTDSEETSSMISTTTGGPAKEFKRTISTVTGDPTEYAETTSEAEVLGMPTTTAMSDGESPNGPRFTRKTKCKSLLYGNRLGVLKT